MNQKAFSVRDSKTELFHLPFFTNTTADAERSFAATVNNSQTSINQFPEDFDLYMIGEYDQIKGKFLPLETPVHMIKAIALIRKTTPQNVTEIGH